MPARPAMHPKDEGQGTYNVVAIGGGTAHAGEVMHEILVAAKHGIGLSKLSGTVHAYPTYSSSVQRVADSFQKTRLTPGVAGLFRRLYRWRRS